MTGRLRQIARRLTLKHRTKRVPAGFERAVHFPNKGVRVNAGKLSRVTGKQNQWIQRSEFSKPIPH